MRSYNYRMSSIWAFCLHAAIITLSLSLSLSLSPSLSLSLSLKTRGEMKVKMKAKLKVEMRNECSINAWNNLKWYWI